MRHGAERKRRQSRASPPAGEERICCSRLGRTSSRVFPFQPGFPPDELGSGTNCSDFLDCLEVPTRDRPEIKATSGIAGSCMPFEGLSGHFAWHSDGLLPLVAVDA